MPTLEVPPVLGTSPPAERLPRLDANANGVVMSPEEFDAFEDWDEAWRYELVHGVVIVSPIPLEGQADPNEELGYLLRNYQRTHPQGSSLDRTLPERYVYLPDGSRRLADRLIWVGLGRMPRTKVEVPTIVVEFVSGSRRDWLRDYVDKRREYAALGVREYWVIDRFRRQMTVFRPQDEQVVDAAEIYTTPLLPGFELPLAALLAIADEWQQSE